MRTVLGKNSIGRSLPALLVGLLCVTAAGACAAAEPLDARSRTIGRSIQLQVNRISTAMQQRDLDAAEEALRKAIEQIELAQKVNSPELHDALMPLMEKLIDRRALLELEGRTMPPFRIPPRPDGSAMDSTDAPMSDSKSPAGVSFVSDVAPILVDKCGGCHVRGSKGGFSLQTFAKLMQGPPEGTVVFAGDVIGSRLIETIETGDMPRGGGRVSPDELATLKKWIVQGATFDGDDPSTMLTSLKAMGTSPGPVTPEPTEPAMTGELNGELTGNETVSFASDVAPLLVDNCTGCHLDAMQTRGGLRMDTLAALLRGGDSGSVMQPGDGESSLIVQKLRGTSGDRMPAGGRPPLKDSEIQLISTWISEGAKVDKAFIETPMKVVSAQAWLASAPSSEVTAKRSEIAEQDFRLAGASMDRFGKHSSDHFDVFGEVSPSTMKLVAESAEAALLQAMKFLPDPKGTGEDYFRGRASVYVLPKRYAYSEFAKMVEGRSVPTDWQSHWKYDGIRAYVAVVASEQDTPEDIAARLASPVASLAVVSRGAGVPRWFAEGVGTTIAGGQRKKDRQANMRRQSELVTAVGSLKSGKEFLDGKLPPERADRMAAALAESMLARERRRGFDAVLRNLESGQPFDQAFQNGLGTTPIGYVDAWLQYVK